MNLFAFILWLLNVYEGFVVLCCRGLDLYGVIIGTGIGRSYIAQKCVLDLFKMLPGLEDWLQMVKRALPPPHRIQIYIVHLFSFMGAFLPIGFSMKFLYLESC